MAADRRSKDKHHITTGASLAGILALMIDQREDRVRDDKDAAKTEVLLSNAGLSIDDIAALMGKRYDAIRVSLNRNRRQ
jgi:hypothetical protein